MDNEITLEISDNSDGSYHCQVWIDDDSFGTQLVTVIPKVHHILPKGEVRIIVGRIVARQIE